MWQGDQIRLAGKVFGAEDTAAIDEHLATYNASGTVSGIDDRAIISIIVSAIQSLASQVRDVAQTVATFADHFTTKELVATTAPSRAWLPSGSAPSKPTAAKSASPATNSAPC